MAGEDSEHPRDFVYHVNLSRGPNPVDKLIICKGGDRSPDCAFYESGVAGRAYGYLSTNANQATCSFKFIPSGSSGGRGFGLNLEGERVSKNTQQ